MAPKFWVLDIRTSVKMHYHKLLSNNKGDRRSGKSSDSKTESLLSFVFASRCYILKACSNEANIMQHCWANNIFLYDSGLVCKVTLRRMLEVELNIKVCCLKVFY